MLRVRVLVSRVRRRPAHREVCGNQTSLTRRQTSWPGHRASRRKKATSWVALSAAGGPRQHLGVGVAFRLFRLPVSHGPDRCQSLACGKDLYSMVFSDSSQANTATGVRRWTRGTTSRDSLFHSGALRRCALGFAPSGARRGTLGPGLGQLSCFERLLPVMKHSAWRNLYGT
jgi:hypothetical protein